LEDLPLYLSTQMVKGLREAFVQITPSLRAVPYAGDFVAFQ